MLEVSRPAASVMQQLRDFHAVYLDALRAELEMPISTREKKLSIETALKAPTMNLSLLSDYATRQSLTEQWQDIALGGVREQIGLPSIPVPSGNIRAETAYFNLGSQTPSHPLSVLLSGRAVSVSTSKIADSALTVSSNAIPTPDYLQTLMDRSDPSQIIQNAINEGKQLKFLTSDIETGGVGPYDLARSVAGQVYTVPTDTTSTVADALRGISQSTTPEDTFDFHMLLPEMQTLTRGQRGGLPPVQLGGRLADIESGRFLPGGRTAAGAGSIFDLTTGAGRVQSSEQLMKYFERIVDPETILVGNNFVNFDIPKLIATASTLPEFMNDPRAKEILEKVQAKAASGQVIDVTEMGRQFLSRKVTERMAAAGGSVENIVDTGVLSFLAPETLIKAGLQGEGVKPASIENFLLSTDLLERMVLSGDAAAYDAVKALSGGAHVASLDQTISMNMLRQIMSGDLDLLGASGRSSYPVISDADKKMIAAARAATSRASATVPTSNIASVGEISDQVFGFLMDTSGPGGTGAADRTLMGARIQTIDAASGQVDGFIHFNPQKGSYEKVYTDPSKTASPLSNEAARREIRKAFNEEQIITDPTSGTTYKQYGPRVISTGINVSEASQMNSTLAAISRFSGLSTIATTPGSFLSTEAEEDAFIQSMTATRKYIGFPHLRDRPDAVTSGPRALVNMMRERFEMPSATQMAAAQDAVYQGGAGLAVLDPVMRSNFVALSTITSAVPYQDGKTEMAKKIARRAKKISAEAEGTPMTDAELDAYVAVLSPEQIQSINMRATESSKYLSEQTIFHASTIQKTKITTRQGLSSKPLISRSVLSEMVVEEGGRQVPIVESAFWKQAGLNKGTLSVVKAGDREVVNLVAGTGGMSRANAEKFTESLFNVLKQKANALSVEQLAEQGYAYSTQEAQTLKAMFATGSDGSLLKKHMEGTIDRLMESGPALASLEGDTATAAKAVLQALGSDIGNDQPAIARGAVFELQDIGKEVVSASATLPSTSLDQLGHTGSVVATATHEQIAGGLMEQHVHALAKAESSPSFRNRLRSIFSRDRVDTGIAGTSIGRNRVARDEAILETLGKIKPKLAMGTVAVVAASAGYYLAKRHRQNQAYDETMSQQPYENPGLVEQANSSIQEDNQQTSARRDPLVTAGVVGELDRNKIGHTGMGPNKYNHLFGG